MNTDLTFEAVDARLTKTNWLYLLAFVFLVFGLKLWLIYDIGSPVPYMDQWDAEADSLYKPYFEGTLGIEGLFATHNEHRIVTTRLFHLGLIIVNDGWNPLLQMVVNAMLHILALLTVVLLAMRAFGSQLLPAILGFSLVLFGLPLGWENTLGGFQSQFYFVILFNTVGIWFTTTKEPLSRAWWLGFGAAILACLSMASGLLGAAAAGVILGIVHFRNQEKDNRRLWAALLLFAVAAIGILIMPSIPYHVPLRSHTLAQFIGAVEAILNWPSPVRFLGVVVRNAPSVIFCIYVLRKGVKPYSPFWFVFGLVLWTFAESAGVAFSRWALIGDSKYLDLYVIAILVNCFCMLCLLSVVADPKHRIALKAAATVWSLSVLSLLVMFGGKYLPDILREKAYGGHAQTITVRNYLETNDLDTLRAQPSKAIPYPNVDRLVRILESKTVRAHLPAPIQPRNQEIHVGRFDGAIDRILKHHLLFVALGIALLIFAVASQISDWRKRASAT